MIRYVPTGLRWRRMTIMVGGMPDHPTSWRVERRIDAVLRSWEDTPYVPNGRKKGQAIDCVRFLASVMDELYRRAPSQVPLRAHDASMHDRRGSMAAMREFLRLYPYHVRVRDGWVEPGDVLVSGPASGGPGHAILVGAQENTVWQASARCVHFTGLASLPQGHRIFAVYRMIDREVWA